MRVREELIDHALETIQQTLPASLLEQQSLDLIPMREAKQEATTRATDEIALMDLMHPEIRVRREMTGGAVAPNVVILELRVPWGPAPEASIMAKDV